MTTLEAVTNALADKSYEELRTMYAEYYVRTYYPDGLKPAEIVDIITGDDGSLGCIEHYTREELLEAMAELYDAEFHIACISITDFVCGEW